MPCYFLVLNQQYLQLHIFLCIDPLVALVLLTGDPDHSFVHSTESNQCQQSVCQNAF